MEKNTGRSINEKLKSTLKSAAAAVDKIQSSSLLDMYKKPPTRKESGKTNITEFTGKAGVYFIVEETMGSNGKVKSAEIVYVGMSSYDLYKTVSRHFQKWNDRDQRNRISYKKRIVEGSHNYKIAIIQTSPKTAKLAEKELILLYAPRDNKEKLAFYDQASDIDVLTSFLKELARFLGNRRHKIITMLQNAKKYGSKMPTEKRKLLTNKVREITMQIKATGFNNYAA
jgi:hypothetical protein